MNFIKYTCLWAVMTFAASCSKKDIVTNTKNETEALTLVKTITNATHSINLYTENGKLQQGYNKIFFQIKNNDGSLVNNATASWKPLMHMTSMQHACPYSEIKKTPNTASLYEGYIVFQMAGNATEYWELAIDYTISGTSYLAKSTLEVTTPARRNIATFKGSDNVNYIVALVTPAYPKVAVNDMQAMVFKMQDMLTFPVINNYKLKIDPRMPGMGNHSSPNNEDLVQNAADKIYHGKLSLTMTGYWKINLQLENEAGTIVKGEPVTSTNEGSSIYFEIEF